MACFERAGAGKQEWGLSALRYLVLLRTYSAGTRTYVYLCALLLSSSLGASTPLRPPCAPSIPKYALTATGGVR